jgi:hypothetical protein
MSVNDSGSNSTRQPAAGYKGSSPGEVTSSRYGRLFFLITGFRPIDFTGNYDYNGAAGNDLYINTENELYGGGGETRCGRLTRKRYLFFRLAGMKNYLKQE